MLLSVTVRPSLYFTESKSLNLLYLKLPENLLRALGTPFSYILGNAQIGSGLELAYSTVYIQYLYCLLPCFSTMIFYSLFPKGSVSEDPVKFSFLFEIVADHLVLKCLKAIFY
jgi:hypothetical protein